MFTIRYGRALKAVAAGICALALSAAVVLPAFAHQEKEIGDYKVEVGWRVEPAFQNQMNGMEMFAETKDGKKMEGLEKTLKMDVMAGGQTRTFDIYPADQDPGHYLTDFIPTLVGDYKVRLYGKLGDTSVDETFESGPNRFSPVEPLTDAQFPIQLASADELTKMVQVAEAKATQAQTFGLIGIGIGIIGLVIAAVALFRRKA